MHLASRFALALVTSLAAVACSGDGGGESGSCTTIGCGASAVVSTPLPGTFSDIKTYWFSICRNGECLDGYFELIPDAPSPGSGAGIAFGDASHWPRGSATLWNRGASGYELEVEYSVADRDDLHDGDVYALTVNDSSGAPVASVERAVTYTESWPNGPECAPMCVSTRVDAAGS